MKKTATPQLTDTDIEMLQSDYRRGSCLKELAKAYGVSEHRCYGILKEAGMIPDCKTPEEKQARTIERRKLRADNCYNIDPDLALWLHGQPDIAKVINDALRLYKTQQEQQK